MYDTYRVYIFVTIVNWPLIGAKYARLADPSVIVFANIGNSTAKPKQVW